MTVAISCNLSDGVVLGVDSAVTVPGPGGVIKVYENAEKLFQLGYRRIGVAIYGLGSLRTRSIGSYIREFEVLNPAGVLQPNSANLEQVSEALRAFFLQSYRDTVQRDIEQQTGQPLSNIPPANWPTLGLVIGGFSGSEYLSEVWHVLIPHQSAPGTAVRVRGKGEFGTNWFAMYGPVQRYLKGFDPQGAEELLVAFKGILGRDLTSAEIDSLRNVFAKHEYQIPFQAMPMKEGIQHVKFLVELAINHHRFAVGAPVVGGKVGLGMVTYRGEGFRLIR
jgi:hypothetical protein